MTTTTSGLQYTVRPGRQRPRGEGRRYGGRALHRHAQGRQEVRQQQGPWPALSFRLGAGQVIKGWTRACRDEGRRDADARHPVGLGLRRPAAVPNVIPPNAELRFEVRAAQDHLTAHGDTFGGATTARPAAGAGALAGGPAAAASRRNTRTLSSVYRRPEGSRRLNANCRASDARGREGPGSAPRSPGPRAGRCRCAAGPWPAACRPG